MSLTKNQADAVRIFNQVKTYLDFAAEKGEDKAEQLGAAAHLMAGLRFKEDSRGQNLLHLFNSFLRAKREALDEQDFAGATALIQAIFERVQKHDIVDERTMLARMMDTGQG